MSRNGKAVTLFLFLLVLILLVAAGGTYYFFEQEKTKNLSLQKELEGVTVRQKATLSELEAAKNTIAELDSKLRDNEAQVAKLSAEAKKEKSDKEEALATINQLKDTLETQKKQRQDLEGKLSLTQDEVIKLKAQLNELGTKKAALETQIKDMETGMPQDNDVELGTIVVGPEGSIEEQAAEQPQAGESVEKGTNVSDLEGKVLTVNKEYDFAVINLGSNDGVRIGNTFAVYHANKYLGDIKVEKLHDSMSAANFVMGAKVADLKNKIIEGDRVVRKAK